MSERDDRIETELDRLADAVRGLESRVKTLEAGAPPGPREATPGAPGGGAGLEAALPSREAAGLGLSTGLSLVGRTLLALGGAFLLRALTDAGLLPTGAGILLGVAYSLFWIVLADLAAKRGRRTSSGFHGVASILIGYPLIWEATTRFAFFSSGASVAAIGLVTAIALAVAWRHDSPFLAWSFGLAAAVVSFGLSYATGIPTPYTALLLVLAVGVLWLSYSRGWEGLPWIVAIAADLAVLRLVLVATGPGADRVQLPPLGVVEDLAVVLLLAYLGTFAVRTLLRRRDVGPFEIFQSATVLLVGLGGAVRVTHTAGSGTALLGGAALLASVACYAVAFVFVRRQLGRGRNFFFYTSFAILLALVGCRLTGGVGMCTLAWGVLSVAAAFLGGRFDRVTLRAHAAVYTVATAVQSGLFAAAALALFGSETAGPRDLPWAPVALAFALLAYATLLGTRAYRKAPRLARVPRLVLAIVSLWGLVGLLVVLVTNAVLGDRASADPGAIAAVGTTVLASAAVLLAWIRRRSDVRELGWVTWLLLAAGGAKLLLQDLRAGGSVPLFVAFAFYGVALITVPRLLRGPRKQRASAGTVIE